MYDTENERKRVAALKKHIQKVNEDMYANFKDIPVWTVREIVEEAGFKFDGLDLEKCKELATEITRISVFYKDDFWDDVWEKCNELGLEELKIY